MKIIPVSARGITVKIKEVLTRVGDKSYTHYLVPEYKDGKRIRHKRASLAEAKALATTILVKEAVLPAYQMREIGNAAGKLARHRSFERTCPDHQPSEQGRVGRQRPTALVCQLQLGPRHEWLRTGARNGQFSARP